MKLRGALLAATVLAAPAITQAQPIEGLYVGAGAGFDYLNTLDGKGLVIPFPRAALGTPAVVPGQTLPINSANFHSNGGFVGLASIGWAFGNGFRAEIEGNYRQNRVNVQNSAVVQGGGTFQEYGAMANGLFDFDIGSPYVFPYAGVGIGYIENQLHNGRVYTTGTLFPFAPQAGVDFANSARGSAAAQAIVGLAFPLPGLPGISVTTEARFIGQFTQPKLPGAATLGGAPFGGVPGTSLKLSSPTNESFLVGLRYAFYVPPPPPPAVPAPVPPPVAAPTRTYLVFFDWDRADLTDRARQIIAEAAANSKKVQVTRIEVNGYTDLSGSAAYNQKLSVRRAEAVAAELIHDGVPRDQIVAKGFGESNPLVPTAQGVREPQNRRVEIILK